MPQATHAPADLQVERVADLAALGPDWSALAERSGNLFATPEWLELWWRRFGQGERDVRVARDGARRIRVILPLYRHGDELRVMGHGPGDELGPICQPADRVVAGRSLASVLGERDRDWLCFVAEDLPTDVPWSDLTGADVVRRTPSPVLTLDGDWERYLASRGKTLRRRAAAWRRLAASGRARVRRTSRPESLEGDLDVLFALHRARWGERADPAFSGFAEAFHREVAALALARGWLRLRFLELDGEPVAASLAFRFGGDEWFYQGGRDPRADRLAPGLGLHLYSIRAAFADGLRAYRLLRGGEPYKHRLASHDPGVVTVRLDPP